VEAANKAIAAAEAKTAEYANKLRHARNEVFHVREQRLHQWAQERDSVLDAARKKAIQRVLEAKLAWRPRRKRLARRSWPEPTSWLNRWYVR